MQRPITSCSENLCKSLKNELICASPEVRKRISDLYNLQTEQNLGFNECPSIKFNEDCLTFRENLIILCSSYNPYTNPENWDVFLRIIKVSIKNFGEEWIFNTLIPIFWDNQLEEIKNKLEYNGLSETNDL